VQGIRLDHVAVALPNWSAGWPRFAEQLGGRWCSAGWGPGFAPSQLEFANGMRLELLKPNDVEVNDFLARFLAASGPGPHHLTYKVDDIEAALDACRAAGIEPVGVDLRDPEWKEAFLHPKAAGLGVVVQLAESHHEESWSTPPPDGFPDTVRPPASLDHVGHAVADLDHALHVFRDVLGGEPAGEDGDEACRWVDLRWPGPGRVRLLAPTATRRGPLAEWLGDAPGRVHHLLFTCDDPASVPGATPLASGAYEVAPDVATGTRLVLRPHH
jgi:catechol 2,3-dioxygenase-like lactoylglutathione lyase family enzyme